MHKYCTGGGGGLSHDVCSLPLEISSTHQSSVHMQVRLFGAGASCSGLAQRTAADVSTRQNHVTEGCISCLSHSGAGDFLQRIVTIGDYLEHLIRYGDGQCMKHTWFW